MAPTRPAAVAGGSGCITCAQQIATPTESATAADGVSRFRGRLGLDAPDGREGSWASISRTLPFGSVTLSETIAARREAAGPESDKPRGLLEAGDCFAQIARNDVRLRDSCQRELRPAAWLESALPAASVAATVTLLTEGFETSVPPPGWVEEDVVGVEGDWAQATTTVHPPGGSAHGGSYLALFHSSSIVAGAATRLYVPGLDLQHAVGDYYVSFWMYHDSSGFNYLFDDRLQVEVNDGSGWSDLGEPIYTGQGGVGWLRHTGSLAAYRGKVISLGFRAVSDHILDVAIDDVEVYYVPAPALLVSKTPDRLAVAPGATLTYTVAITRGSLTPGANLALTDTLDAYQRPISVTASQGACAVSSAGWGGGVTCTLGGLAMGASALVTLTAQVSASLPITPLQQITNTANVTASDGAASAQAAVYIDTCRVRLMEGATITSYPTVQSAIDAASAPTSEVQVAGACFGVETRANVRQAAYVDKTLILRGGYKPDFSDWNTSLYTTYLHAAGLGRVVFINGAVTPLIEGFYLTGGNASAVGSLVDPYLGWGGGLLSLYAAPTIRRNVVTRNDTGDITADRLGGGILLAGATLPTPARIEDNTVSDNVSGSYLGSGGILEGNRFLDHSGCNDGGGAYLEGSPNAIVRDNLFQGNSVVSGGGGLYVATSANTRLDDNRFLENTGGDYASGGGLCIEGGTGYSLQRNRIQGNTTGYMGAGLYLAASAILTNTVLTNNADTGIFINNANVTLRHATIAANGDNGLYLYGSGRTVTLTNVIVAEQTTGLSAESGNTLNVNGVLWHGNGANTGGGATFNVTNAHTGDPAFASDGYHLTGASAAIDQGASAGVSDDIDGQLRDAPPDLGADEYISAGADLIATKSASSLVVNRGEIFTYTLVISNVSKAANATGVIVTDTLPGLQQPLAAVASAGPCGIAGAWGGVVTCVPGTIVTRTAVVVTITAQLLEGARLGEATTNTAIFTSNEMSGTAQATIYAQDCRARLNDAATEYTTVQAAVDAAAPGDLVKIAGVCLGAFERGGLRQQAYLDKTVTLRGGYSKSNWSSPDPALTPTTLDALGQGRVLFVTGAISPTIEDLRITGGDATGLGGQGGYDGTGGGIYVTDAAAVIRGCAIYDNVASQAGAGSGGGVFLLYSAAMLSDNTISGNTASAPDYGSGGGLALSESDVTLAGNTIQGNRAAGAAVYGQGGGIYMAWGTSVLYNNLIQDNIASVAGWGAGGGVYTFWNTALLSNTVLSGNISSADPTSIGSGLRVHFLSSLRLLHTTLHSNTGGNGAGIEVSSEAAATLTNTILVSQTQGIYVESDSTASLDGVLWFGNGANAVGAGPITVTNAITGAPAFAADGYHLTDGSAAIDQGVAAGVVDDIDGQARDAQPDLGADEFYSSAAPTLTISRSGDDVLLSWTHDPAFAGYQVWYSTQPYFVPGAVCDAPPAGMACAAVTAPTSSFTHIGAAADTANNHAYLLLGVDAAGQRSDPSNRVGEFGFALTPGAP